MSRIEWWSKKLALVSVVSANAVHTLHLVKTKSWLDTERSLACRYYCIILQMAWINLENRVLMMGFWSWDQSGDSWWYVVVHTRYWWSWFSISVDVKALPTGPKDIVMSSAGRDPATLINESAADIAGPWGNRLRYITLGLSCCNAVENQWSDH